MRLSFFSAKLSALTCLCAACGSTSAPTGTTAPLTRRDSGAHDTGADGGAADDAPTCASLVESHPDEGNLHMELCSPLSYATNPPSSGNHYFVWAVYQTYDQPFPPGFWVHNLEHGAIVMLYNCPSGCSDDVARMQAFIDGLPADCGDPPRRLILMPNPDLDVRFAASAWGFTLKADCFDPDAFGAFYDAHYGHGLEAICGNGINPLTAGTGGTPVCP